MIVIGSRELQHAIAAINYWKYWTSSVDTIVLLLCENTDEEFLLAVTFLEAVREYFVGKLELIFHHSYKSRTPCDELVMRLDGCR